MRLAWDQHAWQRYTDPMKYRTIRTLIRLAGNYCMTGSDGFDRFLLRAARFVNTMLALALVVLMSNCAVSLMLPLMIKLPPVTLPLAETEAADIAALVIKLPPVMLPETLTVVPVCVVALTLAPFDFLGLLHSFSPATVLLFP